MSTDLFYSKRAERATGLVLTSKDWVLGEIIECLELEPFEEVIPWIVNLSLMCTDYTSSDQDRLNEAVPVYFPSHTYRSESLLFKCPCQVYCGVCNFPHDRPTLSISTSATLQYIRGGRWPNGLGVCLARMKGHGFESHAGTFPDFFCQGICFAGVDSCCLSLLVTLWAGKLFLSYQIYIVSLCIECIYLFLYRIHGLISNLIIHLWAFFIFLVTHELGDKNKSFNT